jgi:hypothetical protein
LPKVTNMKRMTCFSLAWPLAACVASSPEITVQSLGGKNYVRGANCVQYTMIDADSMQCMNESGEFTYGIDGFTAEQVRPTNFRISARAAIPRGRN